MAVYLGMTPREHSSGGKQRLLGISKRGKRRLRTLLILAARAAIQWIARRKKGEDGLPLRLSDMDRRILTLKARVVIFKAAVALANKMTRLAWVILAKDEDFDPAKAYMPMPSV